VKVRLQSFLAHAGVASRRASEKIIVAGRVKVNGHPVVQLGASVDPARDRVVVDEVLLRPKRILHLALNKPRGYLCTCRDPQQRKTLTELLPKEWGNLYPVGRLDRDSEGLIFLTNDGQFCLQMTHPRYGVRKKYVATVEGRVEPELLARLTRGVDCDGQRLCAEKVRLLDRNNTHSLVELELAEGKNHEVRRLIQALGFMVERLQRTQIGPIKLGELPLGKWRTLTEPEIKSLLPKMPNED